MDVTLSTITFGKKAKKEVLAILQQPYFATFIAHASAYVLRDRNGKQLGYVNVRAGEMAELYLVKQSTAA